MKTCLSTSCSNHTCAFKDFVNLTLQDRSNNYIKHHDKKKFEKNIPLSRNYIPENENRIFQTPVKLQERAGFK